MGIVRGGDAEYEEFEPSYEEKAEKLVAILKPLLEESPSSLKLSGKYIATDEVKIIGKFLPMKSVKSLDLSDNQINEFIDIANKFGLDCLIETHTEKELERAINIGYPIIGINSRNLKDLSININHSMNLIKKIPSKFKQ